VATPLRIPAVGGLHRRQHGATDVAQVPRAIAWAVDDLVSGTTVRIFGRRGGSPSPALFQMLLLLWLGLALVGGWLAARMGVQLGGLPDLAAPASASGSHCLFFAAAAARRSDCRWCRSQLLPYLREFARGLPSAFDAPIDAYAARIVARARPEADEIIVVRPQRGASPLAP